MLSGSNVVFWGAGDTIGSQGQSVYSTHGASDKVAMGAGYQVWITGPSNVATVNANDVVADYGAGSQIDIGSNVGGFLLTNFASDPTGIVDLINGVGGYTNAAAALSAVVDDGHGNSTRSLGSAGTIHLIGETKEMLSAANFKIG